MNRLAAKSFWSFSLEVFALPRVARACLALQDRLGLDVNLLLFCCWLARRGRRLRPPELRAAVRCADAWQREVVQPLRRARRAVSKTEPQLRRLRRRITMLELDAERLEQESLAHCASRLRARREETVRAAASSNLACYLSLTGQESACHAARHLETLVNACCGNAEPAAARRDGRG